MPVLPAIRKSHLQIINIGADTQEIVIRLMMTTLTAQCPSCRQWSSCPTVVIFAAYLTYLGAACKRRKQGGY